ncbi:hypothetical protein PICMEDRAFT_88231 [Pichia membranifaciens NRRL Y-2026]|uniref:Uncharacterized protein n=1 Tax=Pichia membranifaciens NRRL Y-2026 TaxID=763406 RepID=A0A1E3NT94_9ASCO|nr:hypothetical protein PICMEDRAFT_88231 [Pichia membranifaciens NRRL Y-2026]ODQ48888.1 hypothetical protein PICMEDRAFT_88231 [Pichia membranifaciens NRRL Y-2026]
MKTFFLLFTSINHMVHFDPSYEQYCTLCLIFLFHVLFLVSSCFSFCFSYCFVCFVLFMSWSTLPYPHHLRHILPFFISHLHKFYVDVWLFFICTFYSFCMEFIFYVTFFPFHLFIPSKK